MTDKTTQNAFHILRIKAGQHDDFDIEEWRTLEEFIIREAKLPTTFTFVTLHDIDNRTITINVYHIMTMRRCGNDKYTEIKLVNGHIVNVKATPFDVRMYINEESSE